MNQSNPYPTQFIDVLYKFLVSINLHYTNCYQELVQYMLKFDLFRSTVTLKSKKKAKVLT